MDFAAKKSALITDRNPLARSINMDKFDIYVPSKTIVRSYASGERAPVQLVERKSYVFLQRSGN